MHGMRNALSESAVNVISLLGNSRPGGVPSGLRSVPGPGPDSMPILLCLQYSTG